MATLTTKARKALSNKDFAVIQKKKGKVIRRFPIHDKSHARAALAMINKAHGLDSSEKKDIREKAMKMLGKSKTESNSKRSAETMRRSKMTAKEYKAHMIKKGKY